MTTIVRTVLGDVNPATLGATYMHEHLILDSLVIAERFPHIHLHSVDDAVAEVSLAKAAGVGAMVDAMPCAGGRDPRRLAEISRQTGVAIVATTGLHVAKYYAGHPWAVTASAETLAPLFIADITDGIDGYDYTGPVVERTAVRAGIIKVATAQAEPDPHAKELFAAGAAAHQATRAPLLTHCDGGGGGLEQITMLTALGVDLSRVVLSHTDRIADPGYHRELLSSGVNLEYDQALRQPPDEPEGTAWLVARMVEEGYADQLMLGTDGARRSLWITLGGSPGLAYLHDRFVDVLAAHGVAAEVVGRLFVSNPARFLAFDPEGGA